MLDRKSGDCHLERIPIRRNRIGALFDRIFFDEPVSTSDTLGAGS